uniref:Serine/threonine-protein kinase PLK n=1 Tax=Coptotermes formosanus TaxID=36987 RepID=R4UW34_COPFO|nr:CAMK family protein kinase [Coptotermes formosanus]
MTKHEEEDDQLPIILSKQSPGEKKQSFRMSKKIGSGGFATVFYAEELPDMTPIAIKRIPKARISGPKAKKKIITEIEIHRSLFHPNIVQYRGVFQDQSYVYILLEYCENGSVSEEFKKSPPFSEEKTKKIVMQVLVALGYLHQHRVIHRDLKLQNLLFDADRNVKVADFGLSAQMQDDDEKRKTICGTPGYLSPELVGGGSQGHSYSVDIWALGVCTFLMLTGTQPFQAADKKQTFQRISNVDYRWPDACNVSDNARNFVDSIMQKDPMLRPSISQLMQHPFLTPGRTMPPYMVRAWWDYSNRYGLTYILDSHIVGACFNDSSRITLSPDEAYSQYFATPHTTDPETILMDDIETHPLRKKLILILHFASELKKRSENLLGSPYIGKEGILPHVKYWAKTRDGTLFRMLSRDVQANFKDHSKLIIETSSKTLYYENGETFEVLNLSDLKNKEKYAEVRKRFALLKEMSNHLV